jgi:hypothetical protein
VVMKAKKRGKGEDSSGEDGEGKEEGVREGEEEGSDGRDIGKRKGQKVRIINERDKEILTDLLWIEGVEKRE